MTPETIRAAENDLVLIERTMEGLAATVRLLRSQRDEKDAEIDRLQSQLTQARERLAKIVECEGENAGRFVLNPLARLYVTEDGKTRMRMSYAGNALVELYEGLK